MIISISQLVRMKNTAAFLLLLLLLASPAVAQPAPPTNAEQYPYARFSPSMAIIIVVLIVALFFMGFFSIYVRHCSDSSAAAAGSARRALSLRTRRPPASRGLEASVIESFPTFSYSEVRDHQIADKGSSSSSLECAVCLCEFEGVETLRLLPTCDHVFHPECIDAWLASHVTCPVCRANLSPPPPPPLETPLPESSPAQPPTAELVVQVLDDGIRSDPLYSLSPATAPAPARRSWSIRMPKVGVFGKFRSHSTGHSLVQPGENLERFTLRLPERVRKEVMDRALLNRTGSLAAAAALPRQGSSSRASFYKRIERDGRSSDRWSFSTRGMSLKSPRGSTDGGGGEGGKSPVKRPSFKCLEPKAAEDETGLIVHDSESHPV